MRPVWIFDVAGWWGCSCVSYAAARVGAARSAIGPHRTALALHPVGEKGQGSDDNPWRHSSVASSPCMPVGAAEAGGPHRLPESILRLPVHDCGKGRSEPCGPAPFDPIPAPHLVDDSRLRSPILLEQLSDEVVVVAIVLGHMQIVPLVLCFAVCGQHLDFTTLPALFRTAFLRPRALVCVSTYCAPWHNSSCT